MSLPTFTTARDAIQGLFWAAWQLLAPAQNGGALPEVQWQGVEEEPADATAPFARVTIRHGTSRQSTFGHTGARRFVRPGIVTVQVFSPISRGGGLTLAQNLAIIARDAFEGVGTADGIWFRNVRIQEIGLSGAWFQMNVTAEFEYDEMR